jgi:transposase
MAMGTRTSEQAPLWIAASELPKSPGHPFYVRLSAFLDAHDFDGFVEDLCSGFYAPVMGRPSLAPGRYFRLLLIGYFEGLDAEREAKVAKMKDGRTQLAHKAEHAVDGVDPLW